MKSSSWAIPSDGLSLPHLFGLGLAFLFRRTFIAVPQMSLSGVAMDFHIPALESPDTQEASLCNKRQSREPRRAFHPFTAQSFAAGQSLFPIIRKQFGPLAPLPRFNLNSRVPLQALQGSKTNRFGALQGLCRVRKNLRWTRKTLLTDKPPRSQR
jgi:hypothetical protein